MYKHCSSGGMWSLIVTVHNLTLVGGECGGSGGGLPSEVAPLML